MIRAPRDTVSSEYYARSLALYAVGRDRLPYVSQRRNIMYFGGAGGLILLILLILFLTGRL